MTKKTPNTRQLLVITAGELFAEHGYNSVSTRMIVEKAGVKLSAIHYHFGSKEHLYLEAVRHAHDKSDDSNFSEIISENQGLTGSPEGQAEIVKKMVARKFQGYFKPDRPEWEAQILIRELATPTSALAVLTEEFFKPDAESAAEFYKMVQPKASSDEAFAWADLMHGYMVLYCIAKKPIELIRGDSALSEDFFRTAEKTLSRAMILAGGLPLPEDLQ